jgi:hypothetical protein
MAWPLPSSLAGGGVADVAADEFIFRVVELPHPHLSAAGVLLPSSEPRIEKGKAGRGTVLCSHAPAGRPKDGRGS